MLYNKKSGKLNNQNVFVLVEKLYIYLWCYYIGLAPILFMHDVPCNCSDRTHC
jgi:hypothetical protein